MLTQYQKLYFIKPDGKCYCLIVVFLGLVVQSITSLTSLLRGQLVKCFTTLLLKTLIFFVENIREASHIFSTKKINVC